MRVRREWDLPVDFDLHRDMHYTAIAQPRDPTEFVTALRTRLNASLTRWAQAMRTGTAGTTIGTRKGQVWISVSKQPAQSVPANSNSTSPRNRPRPDTNGLATRISGAGKTTLLRCLAGLDRPEPGSRVRLDGDLWHGPRVDLPTRQRQIGYLFQDHALFPHLNVAANVAYGLHHLLRNQRPARVIEALTAAGATHCTTGPPAPCPTHCTTGPPAPCPAAKPSASRSPAPWYPNRGCCSSTDPCPHWTPPPATGSA